MKAYRRSLFFSLFAIPMMWVGCSEVVTVQQDESTSDTTVASVEVRAGQYTSAATDGYKSGHVTLYGSIESVKKSKDNANISFTLEPSNGWHVYAFEKKVPKSAIGRPTLIVIQTPDGISVGDVAPDQEVIEKDDDILKTVIRYHKGTVTWDVPIKVTKPLPAGEYELTGWVGFQACADDDSSCDMPAAAKFVIPFKVGSENSADASFEEAKYKDVSEAAKKIADDDKDDEN